MPESVRRSLQSTCEVVPAAPCLRVAKAGTRDRLVPGGCQRPDDGALILLSSTDAPALDRHRHGWCFCHNPNVEARWYSARTAIRPPGSIDPLSPAHDSLPQGLGRGS